MDSVFSMDGTGARDHEIKHACTRYPARIFHETIKENALISVHGMYAVFMYALYKFFTRAQ